MPQEKSTPTSQGLFGLSGKDIVLLSVLIVLVIGGFSYAYLLVQCKRGRVNFLCSDTIAAIEVTPTIIIPTIKATEEVAAAQATDEPIPVTATPLPPTPTEAQPTSTATTVPATPTTAPTLTPTESPSPTFTATATKTAEPTAEPSQEPTAEPTQEATSEPTTEPTTELIVPTSTPIPPPATVIYVQGGGLPSSIGVVSSAGQLLNNNLHGYAAAPAWSPDGRKIAFFGEPGIGQLGAAYGAGEGIWTVDYPSGGNPVQLFVTNHVKSLAWSPNGQWLAFEFGPEGSTHETIVIDAANGQKVSNFPGEQPAWSPDAQKLVIKACLPGCGLWLTNWDGSGAQQITFNETDSFPALSSDGKYMSFASQRDGNWEIYRLQLAISELLRLTNRSEVTDITPVFSRDSRQIYLLTGTLANWRIMVMALDGSNEHLIKEGVGLSEDWGLARPAVR